MNININELETNLFNNKNELLNWFDEELLLQPEEIRKKIEGSIHNKNLFNVGIGTK